MSTYDRGYLDGEYIGMDELSREERVLHELHHIDACLGNPRDDPRSRWESARESVRLAIRLMEVEP